MNIVLDLDSTIISSINDNPELFEKISDESNFDNDWMKSHTYTTEIIDPFNQRCKKVHHIWGFLRPQLKEFLEYIDSRKWKIYVWTASIQKYAIAMTEIVFSKFDINIEKIFTKDDTYIDDIRKSVIKDLNKFYSEIEDANSSNTLLIDDREDVCKFNGNNGLLIPEFNLSNSNIKNMKHSLKTDSALNDILKWFENNKDKNDINDYDECIFNTEHYDSDYDDHNDNDKIISHI